MVVVNLVRIVLSEALHGAESGTAHRHHVLVSDREQVALLDGEFVGFDSKVDDSVHVGDHVLFANIIRTQTAPKSGQPHLITLGLLSEPGQVKSLCAVLVAGRWGESHTRHGLLF